MATYRCTTCSFTDDEPLDRCSFCRRQLCGACMEKLCADNVSTGGQVQRHEPVTEGE